MKSRENLFTKKAICESFKNKIKPMPDVVNLNTVSNDLWCDFGIKIELDETVQTSFQEI